MVSVGLEAEVDWGWEEGQNTPLFPPLPPFFFKAVAPEKKSWDELLWGSKYFESQSDFFSFEVPSKQFPVHYETTWLIVSPTMCDSWTDS